MISIDVFLRTYCTTTLSTYHITAITIFQKIYFFKYVPIFSNAKLLGPKIFIALGAKIQIYIFFPHWQWASHTECSSFILKTLISF